MLAEEEDEARGAPIGGGSEDGPIVEVQEIVNRVWWGC